MKNDYTQLEQMGIKERLRQFGVRPLSHRVAVYRYLLGTKSHPTVDTIYSHLKPTMPSLSRTTVYNVLDILCKKGAVRRLSIEDRESRYDANVTNHIHFKCKDCLQVFDIMHSAFPKIILAEGFKVDSMEVNIEGTCPSCTSKWV
jgi:Fe2+ or Zn2+ uptake regulation protein